MQKADLITQNLVLNRGDVEAKREEIKRYFNLTYDAYESLFDCLASDEAYYARPCSLRHPLIFYFGHTATFFTNKLVLAKLLPGRIDPKIEALCAIGVDEMSWDDLNDAHYEWPSVSAVRTYRQQVREAVNSLIDQVSFSLPIDWQSPLWPVMMGIEHERIHLETSSVLIRQLDLSLVKPSPLFEPCPYRGDAPNENRLLPVQPGLVAISHYDPAQYYGWDNEYGEHQAEVAGFKASEFLVSNAEFLAFVEAGGYETATYWDEEGDRWRQFSPVKHPSFWVQKTENNEQAWYLRCMTEEIPMPWNWPAEVNYLEAAAFCRWKAQQTGKPIRLPSEDEYLRLRDHTKAMNFVADANINLQKFASSVPVDQCEMNGFYDVIGNVWQWTMTPIYPFDGFKVHPLYDDFTTPTFDNKHNIFKGGSWISTGNEINGHSRYAFRRHFFQHAGFRYIESDAPVKTEFPTYETDPAVAQACEFHYGDNHFGTENFAKTYAQLAIKLAKQDSDLASRQNVSVLDVGCSVGRGCFELAKHFDQVLGLDFSARFINAAIRMQTSGSLRYTLPHEGEIMDFKEATLEGLSLEQYAARCSFLQQDPSNLKPIFSGYDMVVSMNLIERLYQPAKFLQDMAHRINDGGLLLLGSTYNWREDLTAKAHWLGGYKDAQSGENVSSLETIHALLSQDFERVGSSEELAFVLAENARCFQHQISQVTLWKKKSI
jgi:5-histidylcysteine sulfoxide synthase/putative 4-mercaptohistidine N1-methyltranferase